MLKETEGIPEGAKSEYYCTACGHSFKISHGIISELEIVICPRCGSMKLLKKRPETKDIKMAI